MVARNNPFKDEQIRTTEDLIDYCSKYRAGDIHIRELEQCLKAIKEDKPDKALRFADNIPLGGMGCFNDWGPTNLPREEKRDFQTLLSNWSQAMYKYQQHRK